MNTGHGAQKAVKSWFPLSTTWDEAGENYRRWTPYNEVWFRNRRKDIESGAGPLPASQWRDRLRGMKTVRQLTTNNRRFAEEFMS